MISEMIHTASLVHDDVIDGSDQRRGKRTINQVWGERKVSEAESSPSISSCWEETNRKCFLIQAILVGDFILSAASIALARIGNITVVKVLSQVIEDLVRGTFCYFSLIIMIRVNGDDSLVTSFIYILFFSGSV